MCWYACVIRALRYSYDLRPQVKNEHTLTAFYLWVYVLVKGTKCFLLLCISMHTKKSMQLKLKSQTSQCFCLQPC